MKLTQKGDDAGLPGIGWNSEGAPQYEHRHICVDCSEAFQCATQPAFYTEEVECSGHHEGCERNGGSA